MKVIDVAVLFLFISLGAHSSVVESNHVDQLCIDFCEQYFDYCQSSNIFINPKRTRRELEEEDVEHNNDRFLVTTTEPRLMRLQNRKAESKAMDKCQSNCMLYPRPVNPALFKSPLAFGSNLGSDTIWCRKTHLDLVNRNSGDSYNSAAFHCPHAGPTGGGICRDVQVAGATPYEHLRRGQPTRRHIGYCDIAMDGRVADCTNMYITDTTLPYALQMLPSTVRFIFLVHNTGITSLPSNIFSSNLANPAGVLSIFMDECSVATVDPLAFSGLTSLQALNLNMNNIKSLPNGLFAPTPNLRQFSMFTTGVKLYSISSLPTDLFTYTSNIEAIIMYGHESLTSFPATIFKGLTKCTIISFVSCGFTNAGFPSGVFSDLISLRAFDFFGNKLTSVKASWFAGGYGGNITRLALWGNAISSIEAGALDSLISLEDMYFHRNSNLTKIDASFFMNKRNLRHLTIQGD